MIAATPRLSIREMDSALDAEFICRLLNSEGFLKYIGDRGVRTLEQAADFIETRYRQSYRDHGYGLYTVELKQPQTSDSQETGKSQGNSEFRIPNSQLGICGFVRRDTLPFPDLGFALLPEFEGFGYIVEASHAVFKDGKDRLGMKTVLAIATRENVKSHRVLFRLGFKEAGMTKQPHDENPLRLFRRELE